MSLLPRFLKLIVNLKEGSSNDMLGAYPAKVHVPAMPERRYLHTTRVMAVAAVLSMSCSMMLGSILYVLPPQVVMRPQLMVLNKYDNLIQPIGRFVTSVQAMDFVAERLIADYVRTRNTITSDVDEMVRVSKTGGFLSVMSEANVFYAGREERNRLIGDVKKHGLTRQVVILWVKKVRGNTWQVRYETIDTYRDRSEPEQNSWYVTMDAYMGAGVAPEYQMDNPFGFRITKYVTTKSTEKPEDMERFIFEEDK